MDETMGTESLTLTPTKMDKLIIYSVFYTLGVVTTVPTNFFLTANDYWMFKFRNVFNSTNDKNDLQAQFTADYVIVTNLGNVVFVVLTVRFIRRKWGTFWRMVCSLSTVIGILMVTCILVDAPTDTWQHGFFVLTLFLGLILTASCAIFFVTLFEAATKFPTTQIPTMFSGQAICGIFSSLVQIVALAIGNNPQTTGLIYFLAGMGLVLLSLIGYLVTWFWNECFRHHMLLPLPRHEKIHFNRATLFAAFHKVKFYMAALAITLMTTVMLHPGVINLVQSIDKGNDKYFGAVVNFLCYFLFDYVGREIGQYLQKPRNGILLFVISCIRICLIPLIVLCNEQPRSELPVVFGDAAYIFFVIMLALTNGFIVNLAIILILQNTSEEERPFAMIFVLLSMIISMAIASPISTSIVKAL